MGLLFGRKEAQAFKGGSAAHFEQLLRHSGVEGELLDEPLMAGPFPAGATAFWRDNLVLTGDAAGFMDPITGEGMSLALRSARLCADSMARYLEHGDRGAFVRYERAQRAMCRNSALVGRFLIFLSEHRVVGRRVILNLRRRPETVTKLGAINNGTAGFRDLGPRDLTALLLGR